jgi:PAS domain S-box-containing protein
MKGKNSNTARRPPVDIAPKRADGTAKAPAADAPRKGSGPQKVSRKPAAVAGKEVPDFLAHGLLSQYAHDIVLILDGSGQIMEANDAALRTYGFARADLLKKNIIEIRGAATNGSVASQLRDALQHGTRFETTHLRADGTEFPVEVVSNPVRIGGQQFLMSVIRDISHRVRLDEQMLRQASMLDLSDDAIFAWYLDGDIAYWNKGAEQLYGFSREEAMGRRSHELLQTQRAIERGQFFEELRRTGSWVGELKHTTKAGHSLVVESRHQVLQESDGRLLVLEINRDITQRQRAQEELRLSEERHRALAHATSQIVWVTDASGIGRESQKQWENITGHESGGRSWLGAVHPDDRERTESAWRHSVETGEPYVIEHRLQLKSGEYRIMQAHAIPIRDNRGRIRDWIGTHTDITERKVAEAALARSEEKLRMSLEAAQMGTWDWDIVSGQLVWGERCKRLFGLPQDAPITYEGFLKAIHPDDRARIDEAVKEALAKKDSEYDVEMRVPLASGLRWIRSKGSVLRDASGKPLRMSGCALDITSRKQDEQALQESEERFRLTFDNAAVGITHVALDGRWLRVNQRICDITGYTREELLRTDFQSITHPDDLAADLVQVERLVAGEIEHYTMEKRYVRRDGSYVWIDLSVSLMRDANGSPDHFISIITDIDERKQVEAKLQQRQRDLEEAQRVGGLGSWSFDPATDTTQWSPELYRIAGRSPEEPIPPFSGQKQFFTADSWERLQAMVQEAMRDGRGYESDLELLRPDRTARWVAVRAEAEMGVSGRVATLRGTVLDISERKLAEQELRRAHQELERKVQERTAELATANASLRVLTARLLRLQDDERRRLSRELHDSAGQKLAVLSMNCAALAQSVKDEKPARLLADAQGMITEISSEIRTMSYLLHPPLLDEVGLESALHWYIDGFSKRSHIATTLDVSENFGRLSREQEITIFRVIQESLTNVLRHSGSPSAAVRLVGKEDSVEIEIIDHGKGIPDKRLAMLQASESAGVGLGGMRERLRQLGGELDIASSSDGTSVRAFLPVREPNPEDALATR